MMVVKKIEQWNVDFNYEEDKNLQDTIKLLLKLKYFAIENNVTSQVFLNDDAKMYIETIQQLAEDIISNIDNE